MQKTTQKADRIVFPMLGTWAISVLLGLGVGWAIIEAWSGDISWAIPILLISAFSATLSISITKSISTNKGYQYAALFSLAFVCISWTVLRLYSGSRPDYQLLGFCLASGLLGAMIVSWIDLGFTDETFVPTSEIIFEIGQIYHQQNPSGAKLQTSKRIFDTVLAFTAILLASPLLLVIGLLIWLQDPGPILFVKHCIGFHGKPFRLYKFRTMKTNAEKDTGPVNSDDDDIRVRGVSRILRKTALDELPQLINILIGEMSFVGPRPLRSVVEIENVHQIPGYTQRFNTLPGLAGLAQICGDNLMPSRDKLRYERIYAHHASVLFDIKLIVIACLIVFYLRWKKDWDGCIPRRWIRFGSPAAGKI